VSPFFTTLANVIFVASVYWKWYSRHYLPQWTKYWSDR